MKNKIKTRKSTADAVKMLLEQYGQGWCIIVLVYNCCNLEGNYFTKEKKNGERKGGKYPGLGKTGAMQLLWIMIASRVGR